MRRRLAIAALVSVLVLAAFALAFVRPDLDPDVLRAKWGGPPSRFVEVAGLRVHVRDTGQGPAVVLIHGLFDSLHTWNAVADALDDHDRVVRFDLPGHGLTGPDPTGDYSLARQLEVVDALANALGLDRFSLVGNSLGGEIAWNYAGTRPERIDRLVLVDAAGQPRKQLPAIVAFARRPVLGKLLEWCSPRFMVARIAGGAWAPGAEVPDSVVERFADLQRHPGNRPAIRRRLEQRSDGPDLSPLARITAPTIVVWGVLDAWIPVENAAAFGRAIRSSTVVKLAGVGHVPQDESPKALLAVITPFLAAPVDRPVGDATP